LADYTECSVNFKLPCRDENPRKNRRPGQLEIVGTAALLFAAQRKGLVVDAETVIAQLNGAGYRAFTQRCDPAKKWNALIGYSRR